MPKITIESIPHKEQRYNTLGDWTYDTDGNITIKISEMPEPESFYLIAVHELIEAVLCWNSFITSEVVDYWDMAHPDDIDPGGIKTAPYHKEHHSAHLMEQLLAGMMDYDWKDHEQQCEKAESGPTT